MTKTFITAGKVNMRGFTTLATNKISHSRTSFNERHRILSSEPVVIANDAAYYYLARREGIEAIQYFDKTNRVKISAQLRETNR